MSQLGIEGAHPGGINLTKKIFERENVNKNSHILDVGCGTGQTVAYLARKFGAHVTGIDINSIMVEKAKKRMKEKRIQANVIQCTVEKLPFLDNQFDFVISESVLSFVDTSSALNEIYRVLKRGGRLIAIELTMKHPLSEKEEDAIKQFYGFNSLTLKKDWEVRLKQAGFDHIRIKKIHPPTQRRFSITRKVWNLNFMRFWNNISNTPLSIKGYWNIEFIHVQNNFVFYGKEVTHQMMSKERIEENELSFPLWSPISKSLLL